VTVTRSYPGEHYVNWYGQYLCEKADEWYDPPWISRDTPISGREFKKILERIEGEGGPPRGPC